MKTIKYLMLAAIVAISIMSVPQQVSAQDRMPKGKFEMQGKKQPGKQRRAPRVMRDKDFSMMYDIVKKASFDDNKIDIIRVACIGSRFDSKQCARLLSLISFDDNRLKALEAIAPRLSDIDKYDDIIKKFSFSSSKEKAAKLLALRRK